jgi:uncharacterized membrane protein
MIAQIEWDKIGQLLWAAPVAGLLVAITYSFMIVGWARASEARRAPGAGGAAGLGYTVLGVVSTVAFVAVVVYGVAVIVNR